MSKIFFTSDTHWGHKNIIRFCNRPYATVEEMDEALINNWNSVVGDNDTVYHLGDMFFTNMTRAADIMNRLNGNINIVLGNHDKVIRANRPLREKFSMIMDDLDEISIDNYHIVLCHYPMMSWDNASRGSIQCHGHIHKTDNDYTQQGKRQWDVGVDNNHYFPVSWDDIKAKMTTVEVTPF
jgi:calcineurin-like phosphoesterase family protein